MDRISSHMYRQTVFQHSFILWLPAGTTSGDNIQHNVIFLSLEETVICRHLQSAQPWAMERMHGQLAEFTFLAKIKPEYSFPWSERTSLHIYKQMEFHRSALFHSLAICGTTIYIHNVTLILESWRVSCGHKAGTQAWAMERMSRASTVKKRINYLFCFLEANYTYCIFFQAFLRRLN